MAKTEKKKTGRPKGENPLAELVATKITAATAARLGAYAKEHDRAASWVLREALEQFLKREAKK